MSGQDLASGEETRVKGSGSAEYTLKNDGGVYSCSCPAWRNQSAPIDRRTCKHLRAFRGDEAETERLGGELPGKPVRAAKKGAKGGAAADEAAAPPLLLAHSWTPEVDPSGWWMSEKLDGVRAFWNGEHFVSRLGNRFFAPPFFVEALPKVPLDGELFGGRKQFQKTVGVVKRFDGAELWRKLRFVVFDAPAHEGVFEERIDFCRELLAHDLEFAAWHEHGRCDGVDHLRDELARVEALGGEGLMMRRPGSRYEAGRSATLLKVKTFHDAEAIVVAHVPGMGKHKGRLGALVVEMPNKTRFNVGTGYSDAERRDPPPVGSVITYRYQELSDGGVPRFPTYVGLRVDIAWSGGAKPAQTGDSSATAPSASVAAAPSASVAAAPSASVAAAPSASVAKAASASAAKAPSASEAKAASASEAKAASASEVDAATTPKAETGLAGARYFELVDGASSKFWEISRDGFDVTTRWGRIGASGQSTTKSFGSDDRARAAYDKLVLEKTLKGYIEHAG